MRQVEATSELATSEGGTSPVKQGEVQICLVMRQCSSIQLTQVRGFLRSQYQSPQVTQIFYWTFFSNELHLYHTVSIELIKKSKMFTGPNQFLLDFSDSPAYFVETAIFESYIISCHQQPVPNCLVMVK